MQQIGRLPKSIYYFLSFTWGILVTLAGLFVSTALLLIGKRPSRNFYGWYFTIGRGWGGFSLGPCSVMCENFSRSTASHEFGHSIQNCYFGPFMVVLVLVPSFCRYWYRKLRHITKPSYDSIWFEGQATKLGKRYREVE